MHPSRIYDGIGLFHRYCYILFLPGLAFFIPVNNRMSSIFLGLMVINWVVEFRFIAKIRRILNSPQRLHLLLFAGFYLLYLIGLLYSHNYRYGRFDIEVKLSLAVIPLMFSTIDSRVFDLMKPGYLFRLYVAGCLFSVMVCLIVALIRFSETADAGVFFYTRFSVLHHAGYFAMFLNFAVALMLMRIWRSATDIPRWEKRVIPVLIFLFTLVVVLLSSKMGILTLAILYIGITILMLRKRTSIRITVLPLASLVFMLMLVLASPATLERWITTTKTVESMEQLSTDTDESTGERILVWQSSWNVIKDHPWIGVGTGDVKDALLNEYAKRGITYAVSRNLDAHNQYLQTTISLGLAGILTLLAMILLPALAAWKRQDYLYLSFLFLFSMNMLVESMFENQAGVVFYAFFNALLFWQLLIGPADILLKKKRLSHGETVSE